MKTKKLLKLIINRSLINLVSEEGVTPIPTLIVIRSPRAIVPPHSR